VRGNPQRGKQRVRIKCQRMLRRRKKGKKDESFARQGQKRRYRKAGNQGECQNAAGEARWVRHAKRPEGDQIRPAKNKGKVAKKDNTSIGADQEAIEAGREKKVTQSRFSRATSQKNLYPLANTRRGKERSAE